jgi:adenosylcobinamide-phosphate synthase
MDSMWGYKTPEWKDFGLAAARLDDALAFAPARLSAVFLRFGGRIACGCGLPPAWPLLRREASRMESPNAGWPMTTAAWLCGARMGGPTPYNGSLKDKPLLGPPGAWTNERIRLLLFLLLTSGGTAVAVLLLAAWLLLLLF